MKKILIIGSGGMLGQELAKLFGKDREYSVTAWDKKDIDIADPKDVSIKIGKLKPHFILNAAAYNAVDKCEDPKEYKLANAINGKAPGYLAKAANKTKATLVQFSTDYVFGGEPEINLEPSGCTHSCGTCQLHSSFQPEIGFREDSRPKPINRYGKTKLEGEKSVMGNTKKFYIIRLSKLFGKSGKSEDAKKSFFETMLELSRKKKSLSVIDEEIGNFTYAPDLAKKTKEILESGKPFGIYHVSNAGADTWFEGAKELFRQAKVKVRIRPITSEKYPRPAKRPHISTLINTKLNPLRSYKEALRDFLKSKQSMS